MKNFLPRGDKALDAWALNFHTVANANQAQLPLSTTEVKAIGDAEKALKAALDAQDAVKQQAKAATLAKKNAAKAVTMLASGYNARIQAATTVPNTLKEQLGLTVHSKPSRVTPVAPTNLVAVGYETGVNQLKWKTGGNKSGATYIIEALYPGEIGWLLIDTTTATRYPHQNQTPGVKVNYRIRARRRTDISDPSNVGTVYADAVSSSAPTLTLTKAA